MPGIPTTPDNLWKILDTDSPDIPRDLNHLADDVQAALTRRDTENANVVKQKYISIIRRKSGQSIGQDPTTIVFADGVDTTNFPVPPGYLPLQLSGNTGFVIPVAGVYFCTLLVGFSGTPNLNYVIEYMVDGALRQWGISQEVGTTGGNMNISYSVPFPLTAGQVVSGATWVQMGGTGSIFGAGLSVVGPL